MLIDIYQNCKNRQINKQIKKKKMNANCKIFDSGNIDFDTI